MNGEKGITYEYCPHCESEVQLPNRLGVYVCPNCGRRIVNCSMCRALMDGEAQYCRHCPLEYMAYKEDEEEA